MAAPSLTYTLTNSTTADADQVMQNFNDLLNGITDASKDLSINALTCAGTATLNGHVNLGNASADDITITGSIASNITPKTDGAYNLGSSTNGWANLYLSANSNQMTIQGAAALAADRTYTIPDAGAAASFVMSEGASSLGGARTFKDGIYCDDAAGQSLLSYYRENTWSPSLAFSTSNGTASTSGTIATYTRIGRLVILEYNTSVTKGTASGNFNVDGVPFANASTGLVFANVITISGTLALTAGYRPLVRLSASGTQLQFRQEKPDTGATTSIADSNLPATWQFSLIMAYYTS